MDDPQRTIELIRRYLDGECSTSEAAELGRALVEDADIAEAFADASRLDATLAELFVEKNISGDLLVRLARERPHVETDRGPAVSAGWRRRAMGLRWIALAGGIAVSVAIVLLCRVSPPARTTSEVRSGTVLAGGMPMQAIPDEVAIRVAGDAPAILKLTDNSEVELEPATSVVIHGRTSEQRPLVELLEGSGTFRVEKAKGKFKVVTHAGSVTALGTEFSVKIPSPQDHGDSGMKTHRVMLAVAVLIGTVQVDFGGKTYMLGGGENRAFAEDPGETKPPTTGRRPEQVLKIGDFEQDLDGFQGAFQRDAAEAKVGKCSAKLENKDKPWVEAAKAFSGLENDFLELRFWVKSQDVKTVSVRLVDKLGHNYQQRLPVQPDGAWQETVIREFNKGQTWGGPADGKWVGPPQNIAFVLEAKGTLWIDGIEALLDPNRSVEFFRVRPKVLGNVFLARQPVEIPVETQAAGLECNVTDFWGKTVCHATAIAKDHVAVLRPDVNARGHFTARVRLLPIESAGAPAEHEVDFAVVEPLDLATLQASPFGAMTHFSVGWDTAIVPLIARAGLASVRDEAFWAGVETEKGVFNFQRYDGYLAELTRHGIQPLIVLTFSNPHYDGGKTPYSAEACRGYGVYAQQVLAHYGRQVRWLEVWNEYNGSFCAGPATQDRPRYYTQMCQAAYQSIKEVRPDVTVLGAAAVSIPLPYFESIFKHHGIDAMDAVVIHPYRGRPEGVEGEIADLRELIKKYNRGKDKPIWATEYGFGGKDPCEPARYLVRMSALMRSQNVERMYWYLMRDFNEFKGMGLIHDCQDPRGPYSPAPAYAAMATMVRLLHDARFAEREAWRKYTRTYLLKFLHGGTGEEVRVCWATYPGKIRVAPDGALARVDLMGNARPLAIDEATVLDVDETPFYLVGKAKRVAEVAGGTTIVADLVEDYSKTQGATGWYYGYSEDSGRDFKPFELVVTPWGESWAGPLPYLGASRGCFHPQVKGGKAVWAVQRWKSSLGGRVQVKGHFDRDRQGDGCTVLVLVDGKRIFENHVGGPKSPTRREFALDVEVKEGTPIDFAVTPGPDNNLDFDNTLVDAQVMLKE